METNAVTVNPSTPSPGVRKRKKRSVPPPPTDFRNESLADRVAAHLELRIRAGVYDGELPGLRTLSDGYGVSRGVLRETLAQLEKRGVILLRHNRRASIVPGVVSFAEPRVHERR